MHSSKNQVRIDRKFEHRQHLLQYIWREAICTAASI